MRTRIKKMNYRKTNVEKSELQNSPMQSLGEEIASSVTHGIGAALSIAALVLLVVFASKYGDAWRIVSLSIYGATLVFLYLSSTLYHSFPEGKAKRFFRYLDHSSIFLLIAGSYTPVVLLVLQGSWGWTLFGIRGTPYLIQLLYFLLPVSINSYTSSKVKISVILASLYPLFWTKSKQIIKHYPISLAF